MNLPAAVPASPPASRGALLIALALLSGCAGPLASLKERAEVQSAVGPFIFEYAPRDEQAVAQVKRAIERAAKRLDEWGEIREPIHVRVMPNHALLEQAVRKQGYDWLRAWARYDEIYVQSPRTWGLFGASQDQVDELILHELTHSLMYQASATAERVCAITARTCDSQDQCSDEKEDRCVPEWAAKQIPLWFREGMASFVAKQAYRWPTLEDLARSFHAKPEIDPVTAPDELYQRENDLVYGAAHHAFTFLVRRYGEDRVREVMEEMRAGKRFPAAFEAAIGLDAKRFAADFKRYVRLRGFRGGGGARRISAPRG